MERFFIQVREVLSFKLFNLGDTPVTTATLLIFFIIMASGWILARILQKAIGRGFRNRGITDEGTIGVTSRLVTYVLFVVTLGVGLQTVGVKLSALFAAGALLAVAIGFAMQAVVQNFVSGVILLVERTIKPGDILEVDGTLIKIQKLGVRAAVAQTRDDETLVIPNSKLVQSTVKNHTFRDKLYRIRAVVGVSYGSDMRKVRTVLQGVASSYPDRVANREPVVYLRAFGSSSVDWEISIWTEDPWRYFPIRCGLYETVWHGLKEAGVVIAFPQVDVHFDPVVEKTLTRIRPAA